MKKIFVVLIALLLTGMSASQATAGTTVDPVLEKAKSDFIKTVQNATKSIDGYIHMAKDMADFGKAVDNSQLESGGKQAIAAFESAEDKAKDAIDAAKNAPNLAVLQYIVSSFQAAASANAASVQKFLSGYSSALKTSQTKIAGSASQLASSCEEGANSAQDLIAFAIKVKLTDYEKSFSGFEKSFESCASKAGQVGKNISKADFDDLAKIAKELSDSADKAEKSGKDLKDLSKYFRNDVEPIIIDGVKRLATILNAGADAAEGELATLDTKDPNNKKLIEFYKGALKELKKAADAETDAAKNAKGADLKTLASIGTAADKIVLDRGITAALVIQPILVRNAQLGVGATQQLINVLPAGDLKNKVIQLQNTFQSLLAQATKLGQDIKKIPKNGADEAKAVLGSIGPISSELKAAFATLGKLTSGGA